jgi:hypothetical protein
MTDSAFQLVDNLGPWTIADFEILMNSQNTIIATNPGQFYYHQRMTNTTGGTAKFEFTVDWPATFQAQTAGGNPLHVYVQYATDPANTWRDWTAQANNVCASPGATPICSTHNATLTLAGIPAGARVWLTVHLDYALKGSTQPSNFAQAPLTYGPFRSTVVVRDQSNNLVGAPSVSSTSLLGRGKKVTVVYGTATDATGSAAAGVWIRLTQGGNTATAQTDSNGYYVFFDGQGCTSTDGIAGGCTGASYLTWTFANGNAASSLTFLGNGPTPGSPAFPAPWTKADIRSGNSVWRRSLLRHTTSRLRRVRPTTAT